MGKISQLSSGYSEALYIIVYLDPRAIYAPILPSKFASKFLRLPQATKYPCFPAQHSCFQHPCLSLFCIILLTEIPYVCDIPHSFLGTGFSIFLFMIIMRANRSPYIASRSILISYFSVVLVSRGTLIPVVSRFPHIFYQQVSRSYTKVPLSLPFHSPHAVLQTNEFLGTLFYTSELVCFSPSSGFQLSFNIVDVDQNQWIYGETFYLGSLFHITVHHSSSNHLCFHSQQESLR